MSKIKDWLALWQEWLNSIVTTGIDQLSSLDEERIYLWQSQAEELGFQLEAEKAKVLLDTSHSLSARCNSIQELLIRYELLSHIENIDSIEKLIFNPNTNPPTKE